MDVALWNLVIGGLLVLMALAGSVLQRLPVSTAMLYLLVGIAISPVGLALVAPDAVADAALLERLSEVAVLVSLFTAGLKLSPALHDRRWRLPLRLAFGSMALTVGAIAVAGVALLGLSPGAAVLLGGILAPTDPVLASDVQLEEPGDRDRLRFSLTGEGGLNDGTAFPFVMLGLGLLGLHELGPWGVRWLTMDVAWSVSAGLAIGAVLGTLLGRLVLYLRRTYHEAIGMDEFLTLGLIALSYGAALLAQGYGFLAVFAAGVALRRIERLESAASDRASAAATGSDAASTVAAASDTAAGAVAAAGDPASAPAAMTGSAGDVPPPHVAQRSLGIAGDADPLEVATDPKQAPQVMARAILGFNEQIERIGEVAVVIAIGTLLWSLTLPPQMSWGRIALFVAMLFLVIRPFCVQAGLIGSRTSTAQRRLMAWFGIRGIGSVYYLTYAIGQGLDTRLADLLTAVTLAVVVASIVVHGVSVTPLMRLYARTRGRAGAAAR